MWRNLADILLMSRSSQWKRQNVFWTKEFSDKIKIFYKGYFLEDFKKLFVTILVQWFLKHEGY